MNVRLFRSLLPVPGCTVIPRGRRRLKNVPRGSHPFALPELGGASFFRNILSGPPLSTVSGPLLQYAFSPGLGVILLKGERDQENQVGLTIDHNAIVNSNVLLPLSIVAARIYGREFSLRSPRMARPAKLRRAAADLGADKISVPVLVRLGSGRKSFYTGLQPVIVRDFVSETLENGNAGRVNATHRFQVIHIAPGQQRAAFVTGKRFQ